MTKLSMDCDLEWELANYDPQAKSRLSPAFVNKLDWHTGSPTHLHSVYDHFCTMTAELSNCDRNGMAHKAKTIYYLALYRKNMSTLDLELCNSFSWQKRFLSFFSLQLYRGKIDKIVRYLTYTT